jgi:hypothetical protein
VSAPVGVLAAMHNASFELRTVATGNEGKAANNLDAARAVVAELIAADHEYDAAQRDWEHLTSSDPESFSREDLARIADRYEAATMRRIAALAAVGGAA